jgi:hypothetical protein
MHRISMIMNGPIGFNSMNFEKSQLSRDEILGHPFNKRFESFASCYSQSLLLADFKENQEQTPHWFY